ncbi:MAG: glycosyltransferase family 1 protein [Thermodesulfobacteriota bacterium]
MSQAARQLAEPGLPGAGFAYGDRLRVCLVTETYFPQVNGVSRTLDRLVRYLTGLGHEVRVVAPRYRERTALPVGARLTAFPAFPLPFYPEILACPARARRLAEVLGAFGPHVVHLATEGPLGLAALRASRARGLPVVSSFHTHFPQYLAFYRLGGLAPAAWRYLRWFHNRTAATLCPTASVRAALEDRGFRNVALWSRGVDADLFRPDRRDPELRRQWGAGPQEVVLACAGRLAAEKNLPLLLEALRLLPRDLPCRLVLIGDGPLRPALEADPAVRDGRLVLTGYRHGEELARAYASADLFVFPSVTETFGNVLLEAMASGLPAVAFPVSGPGDVVRDGQTGCLATEATAPALAAAVAALAADPLRRRVLGKAARLWAESQTWDAVNATVVEAYQRARRGGPPPG